MFANVVFAVIYFLSFLWLSRPFLWQPEVTATPSHPWYFSMQATQFGILKVSMYLVLYNVIYFGVLSGIWFKNLLVLVMKQKFLFKSRTWQFVLTICKIIRIFLFPLITCLPFFKRKKYIYQMCLLDTNIFCRFQVCWLPPLSIPFPQKEV